MLEALAFIKALTPYIPLALSGIQTAKSLVSWGLSALSKQVAEGRPPSQSEWDELNLRIADLRKKLHSDTF